MSVKGVQNVIGKAAIDRAYRELLFSQPDQALQGQDLSAEEAASLKTLSRAKFEAVAGELEEQILAAGVGGAQGGAQLGAGLPDTIKRFDLGGLGAYANTY